MNPAELPFYGRGISFPFRINAATGGIQMSDGVTDAGTVDLAYLREDWTIREDITSPLNHVAESIAHILLTRPTEHDTLPEFGSELFHILFKPNSEEFRMLAQHYFTESTERWEKRAKINNEGVEWRDTPAGVQRRELPVMVSPEFIKNQVEGNLVAPFVTSREQRTQEYALGTADAAGHDWTSRYYDQAVYEQNGVRYIRPRRLRPIPTVNDDSYYEVKLNDTWLLIAHEIYGDIRFHYKVSQMAMTDAAAAGLSRDYLDNTGNPTTGTLLRLPSRTRLLMEIARG